MEVTVPDEIKATVKKWYALEQMEISRKVQATTMPRKVDRPSEIVTVWKFDREFGRARKRQKQEEALERQAVRDKMSPQQQLAELDKVFGEDNGAEKERERLMRQVSKQIAKKQKGKK